MVQRKSKEHKKERGRNGPGSIAITEWGKENMVVRRAYLKTAY